jgi:hypothetical protein
MRDSHAHTCTRVWTHVTINNQSVLTCRHHEGLRCTYMHTCMDTCDYKQAITPHVSSSSSTISGSSRTFIALSFAAISYECVHVCMHKYPYTCVCSRMHEYIYTCVCSRMYMYMYVTTSGSSPIFIVLSFAAASY